MHTKTLGGLLLVLFLGSALPQATRAQVDSPSISSPQTGEALQGLVEIDGTSGVDGFVSAELAFAYANDPTATWFLITTSSQPVQDGSLGTWDTTAISDGVYDLRLRVTLAGGGTLDTTVQGLRVRNYTPIETPTPTPFIPEATPLPTATATGTPYPTPTILPPNPLVYTPKDVTLNFGFGGAAAVLLFVILGIYFWLRRK